MVIFNLDQLDDFHNFVLNDLKSFVTLDYETSSLDTLKNDNYFYLAGIGLGDEFTGCYLNINSLEHRNTLTQEQKYKLSTILQDIQLKKKILVFNKSFEVAVTHRVFNFDLKPIDVLIIATCLSERSSLKDLSRKYLDLKEDSTWEEDISLFVSSLEIILKLLSPKRTKTLNKHWVSFKDQFELIKSLDTYYFPEFTIKGLSEGFSNLAEIFSRNNVDNLSILSTLELIKDLVDKDVIEANYTYIPTNMVSKYCILDTINTTKLFKKIYPEFSKNDLIKSYKNYDKQVNLAIKMERNSCKWDDNIAKKNLEELNQHALYYLKKVVLNPLVLENLEIDQIKALELSTTSDIVDLYEYVNPRSIKLRPLIEKVMLSTPVKFAVFLFECKIKRQTYSTMFKGISDLIERKYNTSNELEDSLDTFKNRIINENLKLSNSEKKLLEEKFKNLAITEFNKETMSYYLDVFMTVLNIDLDSFESLDSIPEVSFFFNLFITKKVLKEISGYAGKLGYEKVILKEDLYE